MRCYRIGNAIVCMSNAKKVAKCCACSRPGIFLCDWRMDKDGRTCDAPLCVNHAMRVGDNKHLCVVHQRAYVEWKKRKLESFDPTTNARGLAP